MWEEPDRNTQRMRQIGQRIGVLSSLAHYTGWISKMTLKVMRQVGVAGAMGLP